MAERRSQRGLLDPESEAIAEAYAALPAVRRQTRGLLSLEPQKDQNMAQTALEAVLGFIPGVGQALAARDIERARRDNDPAAAAMAATEFLPFGRLAGMMRRPGPIMSELDVYHGTPHRFPATEANPLGEFDASKIGTGEGAQAYGHGVYLAEAPEVAEVYRSATNPIARKAEMTLQMTNGNVNKAIEFVKREQKTYERFKNDPIFKQESYQQIVDTLDYLKQTKKGQKPEVGAFYKADLPDEMIDRMLRFEMPLNEMPDDVAKLINPIREQFAKQPNPSLFANLKTVGDVIQYSNAAGLKPHEILQKAGIPGIKYLDAGSRGQGGSGTRNFVVFPGEEKKVRILERK